MLRYRVVINMMLIPTQGSDEGHEVILEPASCLACGVPDQLLG